ncbi:MAG TPA: ABC transporter ATP-binding protein [Alphaproteobacteria bacterium]|nr:ABC transporter ATP-binding protein [Alphaproteobacteria bacterium]USO06292.1 MAG: ABC transporter ATP-binding protein [Rhodospirillales bacterium]HOO81102.1 ABC transporter ATP-binding protein [Alphaproteobacteria bacterium]
MSKDITHHAALPKKTTLNLMKRLVKTYLAPYWVSVLTALLFMALAAAMTAAVAQLMQPILDEVLNGKKTDMILPVAAVILTVFILRGISTYAHTIMMNKVGQSIVADIQKDLFSHFMVLDLQFFHDNPSGQLISRVINDVNVMRIAVSDTLTGFGKSILTLVFLTGVMFYQDWKLSLVAFTIFPFAALFVARLGRRLRKVSTSIQKELGSLSDRLSQIFHGIRQVQAYGMEDFERGRAGEAIDSVKNLNIKSVRIGNLSTPVNEILVGFVFFGIILYGGHESAEGRMSAGQLGAFIAAFTLAYEPMKKLARLNNTMQTGLGAAERVFQMIDLVPNIQNESGARELADKTPSITFTDVQFQYEEGDTHALDGISFTAKSGSVTALVGPSGGGKSTVMNLILRFYDAKSGHIEIANQDIRTLTLETLRRHIALVSQDITIFDDTIAANIAYGRPDATQDEIIAAARAAAAHDFIESFPRGYETQVGEDGVKLSGGQRQRLSIARAILRDAPILLLDEATSALDNESEKLVQDALHKLEEGRTTLVIAHRLSTVQNADQILVLDHGRIVERGNHEALIQEKGLYAKMYQTGLKD